MTVTVDPVAFPTHPVRKSSEYRGVSNRASVSVRDTYVKGNSVTFILLPVQNPCVRNTSSLGISVRPTGSVRVFKPYVYGRRTVTLSRLTVYGPPDQRSSFCTPFSRTLTLNTRENIRSESPLLKPRLSSKYHC